MSRGRNGGVGVQHGRVAVTGRFAFFAATVVLAATLVVLVERFARRSRPMEAGAVAAFLMAATAARAGAIGDEALTMLVVAAVTTLAVSAAATTSDGLARLVPVTRSHGLTATGCSTARRPSR